MNLNEYREEIQRLDGELTDIAAKYNEDNPMTDEVIVRYDETEARKNELQKKVETLVRAERVKSAVRKPGSAPSVHVSRSNRKPTSVDYNNAFRAWALGGEDTRGRVRDDWKRSADILDLDYTSKEWIVRDTPDGQASDVAGAGDDLINDSLFKGHVEARKAYGGMLQAANVVNVATAETSHYAIDDDTATLAATHAQNTAVVNVGVTVDRVSITPAIYSSGVFPVSLQLIRDSKSDIGSWISRKLSRRLLKKINAVLTAALYTGADSGTVGFSNLLTDDDLIDLYFSVDPDYRNSPKTCWMMNDTTMANLVARLVDEMGQPTWGTGIRNSPEQEILGKPIIINQDCDTMEGGVSKKPIVFGDFESMVVHTVGSAPTFRRLDELYMNSLAVGFVAHWEVGGAVVDAGQHPLKYLTTGTQSGDA